ncbi:30S ribosomal protein S11, partial [Gammaproteobacteria bacterium]|nr:30S ribosomal protein S11 [Gammaproteobacteria bacterium]
MNAINSKSKTTRSRKNQGTTTSTGCVYVVTSRNNTKITIVDQNGRLVTWSSGGKVGFKNTKKSTPEAAERASRDATERAKNRGMSSVKIKFKGYGPGRESALKGLQATGITVTQIEDVTPLKHG